MLGAALHGCLIAVGLGGVVLVLCLGNWLVALLAIAHVSYVIACSIAAMVWFGWKVGFIEACMINLVAGFSVDFVAHLAIAYVHAADAGERRARTRSPRRTNNPPRAPTKRRRRAIPNPSRATRSATTDSISTPCRRRSPRSCPVARCL